MGQPCKLVASHIRHRRRARANGPAEAPADFTEYADCLLLVMDAARRAGVKSWRELVDIAARKLDANKTRNYPRTPDGVPSFHTDGR